MKIQNQLVEGHPLTGAFDVVGAVIVEFAHFFLGFLETWMMGIPIVIPWYEWLWEKIFQISG